MKKIIAVLLMMAVLMCGCGEGEKQVDSEKVDIEQFKCQDSIQTVFNVLGETELESETGMFGGEYYTYENLNLWGNNGKAVFSVRNDKETIQEFYCYLNLNDKELEEMISYFSEKYGSYEVSDYLKTGKNTYKWEIDEDKAKELGYNDIHIQDNGEGKYTVFFEDEWSIKTDEVYYEYLNKENEINSENENKETVDMFEYSYDDNNKISVILSKDKETGKMSVSSFCSYENGNLGIMQGDFVTIISTPFENGMDVGYFGTVGSETYSYIISNEKVLMDTITVNEVQEFPEEYKDKFDDMRNELAGFYKQYRIE